MKVDTLISAAEACGARLSVDGDEVEVEVTGGSLSPAMIENLRAHKADVLALLRRRQFKLAELEPAPDWWPARRQVVHTIELVKFCCRCGTRIEGRSQKREDGEPMHLNGECWNDRYGDVNA